MRKEQREREFTLQVRNLSTRFGTGPGLLKAVDNVSFNLRKGEILGIVGESGSGKSVTAASIMRLIESSAGRIENGKIIFNSPRSGPVDLAKLSDKEMRLIRGSEISMVFQEPMSSLNPVYTCGNQVIEAIMLHQKVSRRTARQKAIQLFGQVHLPRPEHIFDSYPHELSGGQKQRVMIAMALSCQPAVLIADEPTTALDVTVQATILDLLGNLRDEHGTSIIFITHDLGVIAGLADRVMVMYRGKTVEQGAVFDVFSNPQHPYTKGLLACRPRLDMKLKVLPVVADFMTTDEDGNMGAAEQRYSSVGEAILMNFIDEDQVRERQQALMQGPPLLQVKDLKTWFPLKKNFLGRTTEYIKAVDGVTFDVYPGETVGLVGESGCGKTTLGRTILRLIEPASGDIIYDGRNLRTCTVKEMRALRKDVQMIFQDPYASLNPRLRVGEAILEPMRIHGVGSHDTQRKSYIMELLRMVNLKPEHFYRYPHEFSGGQRQRICIARALALNPKFIICDESVSALDVSVQAQVLNLLNYLKGEFNFTCLFISHDLSVVKFMADRIIVMNKGMIEEVGFAEEIYENPQKEYTRQLIGAIPKADLTEIRKRHLRQTLKQPAMMEFGSSGIFG